MQVCVEESNVNPELQVRQLFGDGPSQVWQVDSHDPHSLVVELKKFAQQVFVEESNLRPEPHVRQSVLFGPSHVKQLELQVKHVWEVGLWFNPETQLKQFSEVPPSQVRHDELQAPQFAATES